MRRIIRSINVYDAFYKRIKKREKARKGILTQRGAEHAEEEEERVFIW